MYALFSSLKTNSCGMDFLPEIDFWNILNCTLFTFMFAGLQSSSLHLLVHCYISIAFNQGRVNWAAGMSHLFSPMCLCASKHKLNSDPLKIIYYIKPPVLKNSTGFLHDRTAESWQHQRALIEILSLKIEEKTSHQIFQWCKCFLLKIWHFTMKSLSGYFWL